LQLKKEFSRTEVFVLMNENSASASETGAVQDNDRGTIVGRRSLWKGFGTTRNEF
jgi:carboxyl-terminal processing protease